MTKFNTGGVTIDADITGRPDVQEKILSIMDCSKKMLHFNETGFDLLDDVFGDLEQNLKELQKYLEGIGIHILPKDSAIYFYGDESGEYCYEITENGGEWVYYTEDEIAIRYATTESLVDELLRRDPQFFSKLHVSTPAGPIEARIVPDKEYPGIALVFAKPASNEPGAIMEFTPTGDNAGNVQLRIYPKEDPDTPSEILRMS